MTSLKQVVDREGPLDYRRAARYLLSVARQLSILHTTNELHRDVRPAALVLDENGQAQLRPKHLRNADEAEASILDSVNYLAPELALNGQTVGPCADIYSLGCTMYFVLTGHPPFTEGTVAERLLKHQIATAPSILADRPDAPHKLVNLCERMMAKTCAQRPQSAAEVVKSLDEWLNTADSN